jgi:hypothetical protein
MLTEGDEKLFERITSEFLSSLSLPTADLEPYSSFGMLTPLVFKFGGTFSTSSCDVSDVSGFTPVVIKLFDSDAKARVLIFMNGQESEFFGVI